MQRGRKQIQPTDLKARAIGFVVRELREQAGHSQERLSGECGFDRTYISRVERGIINPTVSRLWQIADALKTPLSQIAKRMELWVANQERGPRNRVEDKPSPNAVFLFGGPTPTLTVPVCIFNRRAHTGPRTASPGRRFSLIDPAHVTETSNQ
jgi:transcriptional regulator with XRE-family HTH domain